MNKSGNMGLIIIIALLVVAVVPGILVALFPPIRILFQIIAVFMVYSLVRGYLGQGTLTLVVSALLIWFLVFKYPGIFASLWVFQTLLGLQFMSIIIWGIGTSRR
jgi:hypothetical protein